MFDEELRKVFVVLQALLQLSDEEAAGDRGGTFPTGLFAHITFTSKRAFITRESHLLSVPVVDLVDVPEDDFVLPFHVVGDALLLDLFHEALRG